MQKQSLILAFVLFVLFSLPFTASGQGGSSSDNPTPAPTDPAPVEGQGTTTYIAGRTYWGRNKYIEYIAGDLPIIISAPHGGSLKPAEIPNRTWGTTGLDYRSQEYTREVVNYIHQLTGKYPHVIINKLHRVKLDANRPLAEAAQGNLWAEQAWYEFHGYIEIAKKQVAAQWGQGHYFDFHTNGQPTRSIDIGMVLSVYDLNVSDRVLDATKYKNKSSLKNLAYVSGTYFPELVRGRTSLGGLLQARGFKAVPSPAFPKPGQSHYYNGGYNSYTHGSNQGGTIDSTQIETYGEFLRDRVRDTYSRALAESIITFMEKHYHFKLRDGAISLCSASCSRIYLPIVVSRAQ